MVEGQPTRWVSYVDLGDGGCLTANKRIDGKRFFRPFREEVVGLALARKRLVWIGPWRRMFFPMEFYEQTVKVLTRDGV